MDYTPYYETMRRTSLLRGMTDAELDTLMACFAPRVRRYAKGELLLMAGYDTHEVGLELAASYTHLRSHETVLDLVCRLLLEKKKPNRLSLITISHLRARATMSVSGLPVSQHD